LLGARGGVGKRKLPLPHAPRRDRKTILNPVDNEIEEKLYL